MTIKSIFLFLLIILLNSCAEYNSPNYTKGKQKKYFSSSGFALIYSDKYYSDNIVNKKINNDKLVVMHNSLKLNTPIKIINPINSLTIETKIHKRALYPNIFNVVISNKISSILKLDKNDPFVEIIEIKKNKKFIAKKGNTFDEEKNVSGKAPVEEIKMDILSDQETVFKVEKKEKNNFIIIINDFYYFNSANSLKNSLTDTSKDKNIKIKKINNTKYRLYAGPFKNFNALKTTYISLNNLGFINLNIYKE